MICCSASAWLPRPASPSHQVRSSVAQGLGAGGLWALGTGLHICTAAAHPSEHPPPCGDQSHTPPGSLAGRGFGPGGVGYVRFALVQPAAVLVDCVALIQGFLQQHGESLRTQAPAVAAVSATATVMLAAPSGKPHIALAAAGAAQHRVSADLDDGADQA